MSAVPRQCVPRGNNSCAHREGEVCTRTVPFKQADTCTRHFKNNAKNVVLYKAWQWPWLLNHFDRCVKSCVVRILDEKAWAPDGVWGHGISPSWGNIKGAKNLNCTPGNSGHMSGMTYVVTLRVILHQQPLARKGKCWWDGVHTHLPTWAHMLLGRRHSPREAVSLWGPPAATLCPLHHHPRAGSRVA